uniref:VapE domain-containing protein n=1 Tax=Sphingomonas sp. TaxID=28214 RepID=UPI0025F5AA6E|nr:VapE domain-containing protein [Sphingomonas sp.]
MDKDNENLPANSGYSETIFQITEKYLNKYFNIRYNEVTNELQYKKIGDKESLYKEINIDELYVRLQNDRIHISIQKLTSLLKAGIMENYNPFKTYFENLNKIDRKKEFDYIEQLVSYIKTKNQERFKKHFKKMLVRSVACAINPNVVNKQAFILVHDKQNSGKTTFLNWLCPTDLKDYITESIGTDKDSLIALGENFIINMDELATFNRSEINALKSMLSKASIKIRHPFGRKAILTSRRANFVGSTNKDSFLSDETGSVRWLCFELEYIDWNYTKDVNIDYVWAQAYDLYNSNFHYELTAQEIEENELENKKHQIPSIEMDLIQRYFFPGTKESNNGFYTATDFLKILPEKLGMQFNSTPEKMGKALKTLGFERSSKTNGVHSIKGYFIKMNLASELTHLPDSD